MRIAIKRRIEHGKGGRIIFAEKRVKLAKEGGGRDKP